MSAPAEARVSLTRRLRVRAIEALMPASRDEAAAERSVGFLDALCRGRTVALVGNAESLFASGSGAEIDGCDVVVRMNRGFVVDATRQGARTDVVAFAAQVSRRALAKGFGAPRLIWSSPQLHRLSAGFLLAPKTLAFAPRSVWHAARSALGGVDPSTGCVAVHLLLRAEPSRLTLFGFDWKQTKTFYRDRRTLNSHDWDAERRLLADMAARDKGRVVIR